jgi:hypothetical protein
MSTSSYIAGRKKYSRPQAMLWSNNPGTISNGLYVPDGYEVGQSTTGSDLGLLNEFIVLSDDNRKAISFSVDRIQQRERMINGRMRAYHIADKLKISTSWDMLPSRAFSEFADFDELGSSNKDSSNRYTTDGGAGGVEILEWYESHPGSFWVFLAYDNYKNFEEDQYSKLSQYNEIIEMYISDFSYSVEKRGSSNYDFWNISVSLEEV